jgi:hypothetical protein
VAPKHLYACHDLRRHEQLDTTVASSRACARLRTSPKLHRFTLHTVSRSAIGKSKTSTAANRNEKHFVNCVSTILSAPKKCSGLLVTN